MMMSRNLLHATSPSTPFEANAHLNRLLRSGRFREARHMFDEMPHRDSISWTTLISGYVRSSNFAEALSLFSHLHSSSNLSLSSDQSILSLALKASSPSLAPSLHSFALKCGALPASVFVATNLLHAYSRFGDAPCALRAFRDIPSHNAVSWTAAITALARAGRHHDALRWFVAMRRETSTSWDSHTFAVVFKACADANLLSRGREVHLHAVVLGHSSFPFVANTLATMYSKCGDLGNAVFVFREMREPDVVSWTSLISTYVQMGRGYDAVRAFVGMRERGICPNEYTFAAVVSASAGLADGTVGEQLHGLSVRGGFVSAMTVANALVTLYSRTGELVSADKMFRETTVRDIVSWSAIISAHAVEGLTEESFLLFAEMRHGGTLANEFPLASLLSTCACTATLEAGRQVHALAVVIGLDSEVMVASALINMYAKCGSIEAADQIFNDLRTDNVVSWTAMINGYAEHGFSREAIDMFDKMVDFGLQPDHVAFMGVLTACSHTGMVDLGLKYFESMRRKHGIEPQKEHYGCMVDLLGRAGRLREAEAMIEAMPCRADEVAWSSLLRVCGLHGDAELGWKAAQQVLQLEPECAGAHVALSNIFMAKGRWKEAAEMRSAMRRKGVRKEAGWSWIEAAEGGVTVFTSKDRSHAREEDIYAILRLVYFEARTDELFLEIG